MKIKQKRFSLLIIVLLVITSLFPIRAKEQSVPVNGYEKVAVSLDAILALHKDGSVWEIPNFDGNPVKRADDVIDIEASEHTYFIVKKDHSLWGWGDNRGGQLAENNIAKSDKPVKILDDVKSVAADNNFRVAAIKNDKSVWTWGGDYLRESKIKSNKPVKVFSNAKALTWGRGGINIIDCNDSLYSLGDEKKSNKLADGVKFAKGSNYIKNDFSLWSQGYNAEDKLKKILNDVVYTDTYVGASCAIKKDGSLWAWEVNDDNIPWYEIAGSADTPSKIMDGIKYADCCYERIVAVKNDGSLCAWGGIAPINHYSVPRNLIGNVKKVLSKDLVIGSDDVLYKITYSLDRFTKTKLLDNVSDSQSDGIIVRNDGTKWFVYQMYENDSSKTKVAKYPDGTVKCIEGIILKDDGTLWKIDLNPDTGEITGFTQCGDKINDVKDIVYNQLQRNICALKRDGSLWVWDNFYSSDSPKDLQKPYKLAEGIKETICVESYIFAITDSGSFLTWNITNNNFEYAKNSKKIFDNVKEFGKTNNGVVSIIKKDNSLWFFEKNKYSWDEQKEKYAEFINKEIFRVADNVNDINYYDADTLVYKDGRLYIKDFSSLIGKSKDNGVKGVFEKAMDNVKSVDYNYYTALVLCKDNSLWEMGCQIDDYWDVVKPEPKPEQKDKMPRKVLENVTTFEVCGSINTALKADGSLYIWGINYIGEIVGCGEKEFVSTPKKIMDNVSMIFSMDSKILALKKTGELMHWGAGFVIGHEQPYTRTPLNVLDISKTPVFLHRSYAAVRIHEDIDVLVRINDPDYEYEVSVVLEDGRKIKMQPCADGYYETAIEGLEKEGYVNYKVVAANSKGNIAETEYYKVQVVK